ncbi:hypothetical protein PAAG_11569 [Paracoccidioides lutzii Pb01]|uniref:Uncharacterized protein n=1 Tax=Paracoccidioides lutzii (strain ATCC MYA-826 / Pb01) TaxID=502779 RepID=A0A0A2V6K4_PARBA|nr:hypothetical protein PAAG_11569 [Paracoccidioides lutzii Pb01]KGQ01720.1 hypothetical protein PAAG_11569 [Paracoccidioides lutzii Pb01]
MFLTLKRVVVSISAAWLNASRSNILTGHTEPKKSNGMDMMADTACLRGTMDSIDLMPFFGFGHVLPHLCAVDRVRIGISGTVIKTLTNDTPEGHLPDFQSGGMRLEEFVGYLELLLAPDIGCRKGSSVKVYGCAVQSIIIIRPERKSVSSNNCVWEQDIEQFEEDIMLNPDVVRQFQATTRVIHRRHTTRLFAKKIPDGHASAIACECAQPSCIRST